jgi:hypothetical protein
MDVHREPMAGEIEESPGAESNLFPKPFPNTASHLIEVDRLFTET